MKMDPFAIRKYPRTPHVEGSRLGEGDEDLSQIRFEEILGRHLVIEEKVDGANTAVSFNSAGELLLQSRGHYLTGGHREKHYNLFKTWATTYSSELLDVLSDRYIMYGEWLYAKHTVYYDLLPHYFLEFDVFDREEQLFLSTERRRELLLDLPVHSVPVLAEGVFHQPEQILKYLSRSKYISDSHTQNLRATALRLGLNVEQIERETDPTNTMEGLYIKVEENGCVTHRVKYVRASFLQTVVASESHWLQRPIVPNKLEIK